MSSKQATPTQAQAGHTQKIISAPTCALDSKPGISASSSSSSALMASTRVSPTKVSTRYLSYSSLLLARRLQMPLMPAHKGENLVQPILLL